MADLTWLPWGWVSDPEATATRGWLPHRLLSSSVVWDSRRGVDQLCQAIRWHMYRPEVQQKRARVFLKTGFETVREIGITWDFPALALFWLHMGYAACLATMLDGMRRLCPNVYTRPFDYLDEIDPGVLPGLRDEWVEALHLDADPLPIMDALRRIYASVVPRFPEPQWPASVRTGTRYEYRYWLSGEELAWRISVATEMLRRGDSASSVFYLRFCAYALARIPMVHARAQEGRDVSYLRPEQAVLPKLQSLAPEIIDDLDYILAGADSLDAEAVRKSLDTLICFRDRSAACLRARGAAIPELQSWEPYQPQSNNERMESP